MNLNAYAAMQVKQPALSLYRFMHVYKYQYAYSILYICILITLLEYA